MYTIENFQLEKGKNFPGFDDYLFFVMRNSCDFPKVIRDKADILIDMMLNECENIKNIDLSQCQLSLSLDVDRHTKDMFLNADIYNNKIKFEINKVMKIAPTDEIYSYCRCFFMKQLEKLLFDSVIQ